MWQVSKELGCGLEAAAWLALQHPSYLAMEPGLASGWMDHVRHVAGVTLQHAKRLAACPQVRGQREVVLLVGCNSSHGVMGARNKKKDWEQEEDGGSTWVTDREGARAVMGHQA